MKLLERGNRRRELNDFRRDQLKSVEARDKTAKQIARDRLTSEDANRKAQRLQDRAGNVLKLVDAGNADGANAILAKDPELRAELGLPEGMNLKNKPMSLSDMQALSWGRLTPQEQSKALVDKGEHADTPNKQLGEIQRIYMDQGWDALTPQQQDIFLRSSRDPEAIEVSRIINDPLGNYRDKTPEEKQRAAAELMETSRQAKISAKSATAKKAAGGDDDIAAKKDRVLKMLGGR
jgi:hypothetical protein